MITGLQANSSLILVPFPRCPPILSSTCEVNILTKIQRQCRMGLSFLSSFLFFKATVSGNCLSFLTCLTRRRPPFFTEINVPSFGNANENLSLIAIV